MVIVSFSAERKLFLEIFTNSFWEKNFQTNSYKLGTRGDANFLKQ